MRINKYLAQHGIASRRKSEELILAGKVKVNGKIITELSYQIDETKDVVKLDDKSLVQKEAHVYYILNKPKGIISAANSKYGEKTVVDLIKGNKKRLYPVGRLDKDTEGLIIITNDGDLAYQLTHPKFEQRKTYEALLKGKVHHKDLEKLSKGVMIDGQKTHPAHIRLLKMIGQNSLVEFQIHEGKNRQIRKMADTIRHPVLELRRTKEAGLEIDDLKIGEYRELNQKEISNLKQGKSKKKRRYEKK